MENIQDKIFERKMTRITVVCCDIMMIIMMILCPSWLTLAFLGFLAVITYFAFREDDYEAGDKEHVIAVDGLSPKKNRLRQRIPQIQIFRSTLGTWDIELTDDVNEWILNHRDEIYGDVDIKLKLRDGMKVVILTYMGYVPEEEVAD